jgi:hypothetical protein
MRDMKVVRPGRANIIHVETPLGIVNIYVGLHDLKGRRVERVSMIPNSIGEHPVILRPGRFVELKTRRKSPR